MEEDLSLFGSQREGNILAQFETLMGDKANNCR